MALQSTLSRYIRAFRPRVHLRLLRTFVIRDLREQYAGTFLGTLWAFAQPLLLVLIYWWVFAFVWALKVPEFGARGGEMPFVVFLLAALLPWLAFQDAVNRSASSVLNRGDVVRHGDFPVMVFPLARVVSVHAVFFVLVSAFALVVRTSIVFSEPWLLLALIIIYGLQIVCATGVGLLISALSVYIRDLPLLVSMLLMGVFFTAPVLYPITQVPEHLRSLIWLNPYTPFADAYHSVLLAGQWPSVMVCLYMGALSVGCLTIGWVVFSKLRPGFADVV